MSHKGMIFCREAGKGVPTPLFEAILKKYPSCAGIGMILDGAMSADLVSNVPVSALVKTIETYPDTGLMMYFGDYPTNFVEDDLQPFTVLKDKDETIALAFIVGAFPGFMSRDQAHSEHYNFSLNHLTSTLAELWLSCEKDFDKFKGSLDLGLIRNSILAGAVMTSYVALMLKDGTVKLYQKDGVVTKTSFGWVTDLCGVKEGEFPERKETPATPLKNKGGFARATANVAPPQPTAPAIPTVTEPEIEEEEEEIVLEPGKTDTALPVERPHGQLPQFCYRKPDGTVWFKPPAGVHGNALKKLYNAIPGKLPTDPSAHWKHHRPDMQLSEKAMRRYGLVGKDLKDLGTQITTKQEEPIVPKQSPAPTAPPVDQPYQPIIGPGVIEKINATMKSPKVLRYIDDFSNTIISPITLADSNKHVPDYAETFGVKSMLDTVRWSEQLLLEIGRTDLQALARFAVSWRWEALKRATAEELSVLNPKPIETFKSTPTDKKVHPALARLIARGGDKKVAM